MKTLFVIKVTIKLWCSLDGHLGPPPSLIMLTIEPRMVLECIFEHVVQSLLNTCLLGLFLDLCNITYYLNTNVSIIVVCNLNTLCLR